MPQNAPWTVGRLLQWTTDYLKRHGAESPRLDAEVLLAHARGSRRIDLYTAFDEVPSEQVLVAFRDMVRRRAERMPVAYLVGHREFYSLDFRVTPDVLIPRPETETLVLALIELARQRPGESVTVCDVGTGSGNIAVAAARHLPSARVTAVDASPAALEVARQNAQRHGVADRIEFLTGDLLSPLKAEANFDFVVSNPPYVKESEFESLAPDVRDFEPRAALVAGKEGTETVQRLTPQAAEHLDAGGYLLLEVSPTTHDAVLGLLAADGRFDPVSILRDFNRLPRVVQGRRKGAN
jgi:release factor glutamine methyltransferase